MYIRKLSLQELTDRALPFLKAAYPEITQEFAQKILSVEQERLKKLSDISENIGFFFSDPVYDTELLRWKKSDLAGAKEMLEAVKEKLLEIPETDYSISGLEEQLMPWIKENEYGVGDVLWPLRVALSGEKNSPSPFEIASVIGKESVLTRIDNALEKLA